MELTRYRRLFRVLFFIGAMIVCFGIGLYQMEYTTPGVVLMILGISILVIAFTITKFFLLYTLQNGSQNKKG